MSNVFYKYVTHFLLQRKENIMARSPNIDKAYELYQQGMKLIDIANKLSVPPGTVRRWKSTYKWDSEQIGRSQNKSERSVKANKEKKKVVVDEVKEVMSNPELTDKQRLFCLYYSKSFNATRSYQKAYGCSYESAMALGPKLLGNVRVKEEIMRLKEERYSRAFLKEEDIFQKYMDIAFSDIGDYLKFGQKSIPQWRKNKNGEYIKEIDPNTGQQKVITYSVVELNESVNVDTSIVSEVSEGKDGVKVKLSDRMAALKWLADHMDLATEEQRARIAALKSKANDVEEEDIADDGFLEALNGSAKDDWSEENE